jgi:hypothetical protein
MQGFFGNHASGAGDTFRVPGHRCHFSAFMFGTSTSGSATLIGTINLPISQTVFVLSCIATAYGGPGLVDCGAAALRVMGFTSGASASIGGVALENQQNTMSLSVSASGNTVQIYAQGLTADYSVWCDLCLGS